MPRAVDRGAAAGDAVWQVGFGKATGGCPGSLWNIAGHAHAAGTFGGTVPLKVSVFGQITTSAAARNAACRKFSGVGGGFCLDTRPTGALIATEVARRCTDAAPGSVRVTSLCMPSDNAL